MAYASQHLEGIASLYESMRVRIGAPELFSDNRAAVRLASGFSEWRTKARINRVMGVKNLMQLGLRTLAYTPTLEMQAGALKRFMPQKTLQAQRTFMGRIPHARNTHE